MTAASASADEYAALMEEARASEPGAEPTASEAMVSSPRIFEQGSEHHRHRMPPGTRIGDHLVVRGVLGEGGTAVVYEALHTRLGASVALKVIDVSDEFMEGAHARLLREAHVCASLEDPHIPRIYDVGELPDGTPYVVMERVSGRTLEHVLQQGALPLDIAVQITDDLLLAVDAIERAGIVHRDIKPPNIILQTNAEGVLRIRLMDFGVSKNVGSEREPTQKVNPHANPSLTQQGAIVGTPHYMAPEQIVGPSVDPRADLYAVGVVAYEMMSGRTAFEGESTGDVVAAVLHTRPLPLRKLRDVHEAMEAWVDKAMAPRRSERYQSARQMREALREAWEAHLEQVGSKGSKRWAKRARVASAFGLVAIGMMLPVPSAYESGLGRLLGNAPSPSTQSVSAAGALPVEASTAKAAADVVTQAAAAVAPSLAAQPVAAQAEAPAAEPLLADTPESDWNPAAAVEASARAIAASETAKGDKPSALVAPAAPVQTTPAQAEPANAPRPPFRAQQALQGQQVRPAQAAAQQKKVFGQQGAEVAPAQDGILMGDYVQQLDQLTNDSTPVAPVRRPPSNPYDIIPDNPYSE